MTPEKIGRYEVVTELDRGGMSTVFLARDPNVGREVAIKLLPREFLHHPTFRERFRREARIIASLEHPAIVPVYDFGEDEEQPYFVMRHMEGGSLADRVRHGPLSINEAAGILQRIGSALDHAHDKGIVHRDLKPANILFDRQDMAYLADFGIARLEEAGATLTGTMYMGTPAYMSPEQVQADQELDGRADIYALGVILFEVLTGRKPYEADTPLGLALKHVTEPVPHVRETMPDLPSDVDQVISRAMAKNREERYTNAAELMEAVTHAAVDARSQVAGPVQAATQVDVGATMVAPEAVVKEAPKAARKEVGKGAPQKRAEVAPKEAPAKRRRALPWALVAIVGLVILCGGAAAFAFLTESGRALLPFLSTPTATATVTVAPTATEEATATATATAEPSATATPSAEPTETDTPTPQPTATITPSNTPTEIPPSPTLRPTSTPEPTATRRPATATYTPSPPPPPPPPPPQATPTVTQPPPPG